MNITTTTAFTLVRDFRQLQALTLVLVPQFAGLTLKKNFNASGHFNSKMYNV